jgi:HEAT repeat protein
LLETPSWRDNIKASALSGLGALQDKKAIDLALRYAERGNAPQVRTAAIAILGKVGTGDARAFQLLSDTVTRAFESGNSSLGIAAAEALASLGDPKGLPLLDQIRQTASAGSQIRKQLTDIQERLRKATTGVADTPPQQP